MLALSDEPDILKQAEEMKERLEEAKSNILAAQAKQKQLYDEKHSKPDCFQVGQQVLKKDFTRRKRKGGKLDHRFLGPFVIKQQLSRGVYLLNQDGKEVKATGAHLKPYVQPVEDSVSLGNEKDQASEDHDTATSWDYSTDGINAFYNFMYV